MVVKAVGRQMKMVPRSLCKFVHSVHVCQCVGVDTGCFQPRHVGRVYIFFGGSVYIFFVACFSHAGRDMMPGRGYGKSLLA